ncbi:MAG: hypothetical protein KIS66_05735 [Fimbriimonadaceae bacterium]|nr:hypothetical protein [Fimbriimonadaceae bacterium]
MFSATALLFVASLTPGTAPADYPVRLGLTMGIKDTMQESDFIDSLRELIRLEVDGAQLSHGWNDLEPAPGQFAWKTMEDEAGWLRLLGAEAIATVKTLDTIKRVLPSDLGTLAWDDPKLLARWKAFLDAYVRKLPPGVRWLSLGNEVDGYLAVHPDEVGAYLRFLETGRSTVKAARPDLKVGVTLMRDGLVKRADVVKRLAPFGDVSVFTYYPMADDMSPLPASETPGHFTAMLAAANGRPLVLQEIGLPSSPVVGSSEAIQAEFVRGVFAELDKHQKEIPLACFFLQLDIGPKLLDKLETYYGVSNERFRAFLGSLGLRTADGKPKAAHRVFRDAVRQRKDAVALGE